jgi:NodT family efflux transporter outer membrane factor (OMF) lipoprotein
MTTRRPLIGTMTLAALLGGCTVGPDFHRPANVPPAASLLEGGRQAVGTKLNEAPPPDQWWTTFADPVLSSLEERVAAQSLDIQTASVRLEQARAQRRIIGGDRYPSVGGSASYQRTRTNPNGPQAVVHNGSPGLDIFDGGFDTSWDLDLWGRVRRSMEAANARQDAAENYRRLALLLVEAELARDYIALRGSQAQLDVLRDNLEIARNSVALTRSRFDNGVTTRLDVANAEAQVSSIEASIPTIEAERDTLVNALSLLLALPPRALESELAENMGMPVRPKEISVGIPSELLLRRPDIQQAEDELHAATAEIGVAKADFFPRISLNGNLASQTFQLSSFGSWASRQFSIGPSITLPFFQGGRLRGTLDLRKAEQQEAAIRYQQIVLGAWHEVDDALINYTAEERRRDSLTRNVDENALALSVAQRRYKEGAIDFLNVLSVQKSLLDARSETIRSDMTASVNLIKLFKALGGGWEAQFPNEIRPQGQPVATSAKVGEQAQ